MFWTQFILKIAQFFKDRKNKMKYRPPTFTVDDVINKFGENPTCSLTGQKVDINNTKSYHFDHKLPVSRGGDNSIDNLQILTREANQSKSDLTNDEFIELCKTVLIHQGYQVTKTT